MDKFYIVIGLDKESVSYVQLTRQIFNRKQLAELYAETVNKNYHPIVVPIPEEADKIIQFKQ